MKKILFILLIMSVFLACNGKKTTECAENGHEWVDLGLTSGTKWAACNIGASKPEEYGDYYAWGETETKELYDWSTYKWCDGTSRSFTKYCTDFFYGSVDSITELDVADDVAVRMWGGRWRMPSKAQQDELREECDWEWTTVNGVCGYKIKSRVNSSFIFLPAAGFHGDADLIDAGSLGVYWSRTLFTSSNFDANYLFFRSERIDCNKSNRSNGFPVRAITIDVIN